MTAGMAALFHLKADSQTATMSHMKVAIIAERAGVSRGGAERSVLEMSDALIANGVDVTLHTAQGRAPVPWIKPVCAEAAVLRISFYNFANAIRRHLTQNRYDVIHSILPMELADVYQPRSGSYPATIARHGAAYQNNITAALKRATSSFNFRRLTLARAEKRLCKNLNGPVIAALSHYVADQFRHYYGVSDGRIVIVANGVKIDQPVDMAELGQVRQRIVAQHGNGISPVFFLFAGDSFHRKGLRPLLKAIQTAKLRNTSAVPHLLVAGKDKIEFYQRIARKLGIENNVSFLGKINHIQNVLAISDAAVLPTFNDPASRFILEALAMAKPVITTRYNGAIDLFIDNRHGIVVDDPTQTDRLAQALLHFCDQANRRKAAAAIVADNLKEKVSMDRHARELIELYKYVIARKHEEKDASYSNVMKETNITDAEHRK
jgi:UDP-glucose:(heptosyl)LPS alpha-1,3-glucosyltransferase